MTKFVNIEFKTYFSNLIQVNILINLNLIEFNQLMDLLENLIDFIYVRFNINDKNSFEYQLKQNNNRDLIAIFNLLLPYIDDESGSYRLHKLIYSLKDITIKKDEYLKKGFIYPTNDPKNNIIKNPYIITNLQFNRNIPNEDYLYNIGEKDIKNFYTEYELSYDDILNNFYLLLLTIDQISHKLYINWLNIRPIGENYKESNLYKNTFKYNEILDNFTVNINDKEIELDWYNPIPYNDEENLIKNNELKDYSGLSVGDMYNMIHHELYFNIKELKWLIYDLPKKKEYNNYSIYYELFLDIFDGIKDYIENEILYELIPEKDIIKFQQIKDKVLDKINDPIYEKLLYNILYFLQRKYSKQSELNLSNFINLKVNFKSELHKSEDNLEKILDILEVDTQAIEIKQQDIIESWNSLKFEHLYNFMVETIESFKKTWYGYNIIIKKKKYPLDETKIDRFDHIISYKNIYNYAKSLIIFTYSRISDGNAHYGPNNLYFYKYNNWSHLGDINRDNNYKNENTNFQLIDGKLELNPDENLSKFLLSARFNFITGLKLKPNSLDTDEDEFKLFNITRIIKNYYYGNNNQNSADRLNKEIYTKIRKNIIDICFECLFIRGLLNEFVIDREVTDKTILTNDFDISNARRKTGVIKNIFNKENIEKYNECFYYLTSDKYKNLSKINGKTFFEYLQDQKWYTFYAMDWVAQISFYHRYINNRVIYVTGATGQGKSTQVPKLLLYSLKMIDFKLNGKVVSTQPRITPTISNAKNISNEMGVPILYSSKELKEDIKTFNSYLQYKTQNDYHLYDSKYFIKEMTDGSLISDLINNPILKKIKDKDKNDPYHESYNFSIENIYDIVIIDESHEHNKNMDIILTLMRYTIFWNNSLKLIIVSATMTEDEPIYRRYYREINDNMMFPLNLFNSTILLKSYNSLDRINVDRRIHISPPGETTQHKVIEEYLINDTFDYEDAEAQGLKQLYKLIEKKVVGDILFFTIGQNEIIKLVKEINNKTPSNVIALPFYAKLPEYWKEIAEKTSLVYKDFNINKNEIFNEIESKGSASKVSPGTYNQVIVVATNVAEASITIINLKHVIDTGYYYSVRYDALTKGKIIEKAKITESSRLQRKGRVGRVASGNVYYMYKKGSREEIKPSYNICNDDIKNELFKLLRRDNNEVLFIRNEYLQIESEKINRFDYINDHRLKASLLDDNKLIFNKLDEINIDNKIIKDLYKSINNIMNYQYLINLSDGKKLRFIYFGNTYNPCHFYNPPDRFITGYDLSTIVDIFGSFYIINPCEDMFYRHNLTGLNDIYYNYKNNKFNDNSIKKIFTYVADLFYSRMIIPNKKLLDDISIKSFSKLDIINKIVYDKNKYKGMFNFLIDKNNNDIFSKTSFSDKLLKLMDIIELDQDKSDSTIQNYLLAIIYGNILDINDEICQTVASLLAFGNDISQLNPILYKNPYKQFINKNNYGDIITFYNIFKKFYNDFKHLKLWDDTTEETTFDIKFKIDLQKYNEIKLKMIYNYSKNYDIMKDISFNDSFNFYDFLELQKIDQKNNLNQEIGKNNYLTFKKSKIKKKINEYNAIEIIKWAKLRNLDINNVISMIKKYKIIKSKVNLNIKHLDWFKNNMDFNKELILEQNIVKSFLFSYIQNLGIHHRGNFIEHISLTSMGKIPFKKFGVLPDKFVFYLKYDKFAININNIKVKWLFEFIPDILLIDVIKVHKKEDIYFVIDLINHFNKNNFIKKKGNNELTKYLLNFI